MPAGRPTKYKPEYCDMVINHMAQGLSKESFAGVVGTHKQTIYNWTEEYPEFLDAVKRGEELSRLFWEDLGRKGAMGSEEFNAAAWIFNIKNRFREEWRDKQDVEHSGGVTVENVSEYRSRDEN